MSPSPLLSDSQLSSPEETECESVPQIVIEADVPADEPASSQDDGPPTSLARSYSTESIVSTQSAPPPYELYPPAKSVFGRAYNWLRKIPRFATHQAIYLPTLPIRRARQFRSDPVVTSPSVSATPSPSRRTSGLTVMYYRLNDHLPSLPRFVLPVSLARLRGVILCTSFLALLLCSFLLFCSVFFAPASLPPTIVPDKVTDESARFLTLNIFMRPPLIKNNWSDYKDERLDYIIRHILPQYDVIAFQESFSFATRRKDTLIKEARRIGFNHHIESPRRYPWSLAVDGGLLLISRFPIRQSDITQYPRGTHSDWLAQKGALHALIELNATRSVHVYTTHTQASYDTMNSINEGDTWIRLSQFAQLHQLMSDTAQHDNMPIIVMGDLNVDAAVHGPDIPVTRPSVASSREYNMMVDVITGKGIDPKDLDSTSSKRLLSHPWRLDDLTDIVYAHYGHHPVTFGDIRVTPDGNIEPAETVLTDAKQLKTVQSIDRVFWSDRGTRSLSLEQVSVERFMVKDNEDIDEPQRQDIPFTQISDHYGLSYTVHLT